MNLMDMFYPPFTPPNIPGRVHLLKDDAPSKASVSMVARWQNTDFRDTKVNTSPKRDKIIRCFRISGWATVAQVAKKTNMQCCYVQRVAARLTKAGELERRILDRAKGTYEYKAKGAPDAS